ncbi:MAG: DNA polymerase I [Thermoleophilia bacterium]|nr:DNA polymerase I [Thermoleophilia bacterium]
MAAAGAKAKVKTSDFDDAPARDATLFLIDGSSLAYRSFFALPQEIATADGRPTNALLGFANMLIKLVTEFDPATVVVAWDVGGETERRKEYAEYKSQRPPMPDLLSEQWPHFQPLVEAFGYTNVAMQGYEADDVIGTLSRQASEAGTRTCIVTYDRDAMQLVDEHTVVLMTTKGVSETAAFTPERVQLRYDVRPDQIADFISLRGDTSDNIPGIPGIGDKTAADLLRQFGSLEGILDNIDKVSGAKRKENLAEFGDQSRMSKRLATIVRDLPLDVDLEALHAEAPDRSRLLEIFRTFEFRSLARRVEELDIVGAGTAAREAGRAASTSSGSSSGGDDQPASGELVSARLVSPHELGGILDARPGGADAAVPLVVRDCDDGSTVAAVLVEEGVPDGGNPIRWVAVMQGDVSSIVKPLQGRPLLAFDHKGLPHSLRTNPSADDLLLVTYLLQPGRRTILLGEVLAEEGLSARVALASGDALLEQVAAHAALLPALRDRQLAQLRECDMEALYRDIELPVIEVLVAMEDHGIEIDRYRMGEIAAKVADQLDELVDRAHELAGHEFSLGSPKQLATVLFDELELPAQRKGKTGFSTDARVLRDLRDMHPIIGVIESWRELSKLKGTYLDTLPELADPKTNRIHTTFSQVTAATGRLSSINPNLQNIPVRTSVGREIRSAFVPAEGCRFVSCDYSQVELRLLAHVSQEPKLIETFERGDDVHTMTAAEVAGVEPAQVSREQRSAAKAINFGIIYGISSFGLSQQLQISREEAQEYIDRYLGRYPHVSDFIERTIEYAKEHGHVRTLFGRRRPIPELKSRDYNKRQLGERLAVNTVLQGTAADIMKLAMVRTHAALRDEGLQAKIALQIHDELLLEVPDAEVRAATALVKREMVGAFDMTPPLEVDSGSGTSWLDAK